jgi:hypothetical protein
MATPFEQEVHNSLKLLPPSSTLGLDGFIVHFLTSYYHIVKDDLVSATRHIFVNKTIKRGWKATFLVLIPKVDEPLEWKHFISLSLCNVGYKLLTKIIARRLEVLFTRVISIEQHAYVKNRCIGDCVGIA